MSFRASGSRFAPRQWQAQLVPHHELVDVSVSMEDGARRYTGRCRCGWTSASCDTGVHALALVDDHADLVRLRRRRPGMSWAQLRTETQDRPAEA
jgi:hypothetical protein